MLRLGRLRDDTSRIVITTVYDPWLAPTVTGAEFRVRLPLAHPASG